MTSNQVKKMKYIISRSIGLTAALLLAASGMPRPEPAGDGAAFASFFTTSVDQAAEPLALGGGVTRLEPTDPDKISGFKEQKIEYLNEYGKDFARVQVFAYALE